MYCEQHGCNQAVHGLIARVQAKGMREFRCGTGCGSQQCRNGAHLKQLTIEISLKTAAVGNPQWAIICLKD